MFMVFIYILFTLRMIDAKIKKILKHIFLFFIFAVTKSIIQ